MAGNTPIERLVSRAGWLDRIGDPVVSVVAAFYRLPGMWLLKSALNGTWLRHPLHALITDVTVGGYTMVVALDLLYMWRRDGALLFPTDAIFVLTFLSSLLSALSGLTDWHDTSGRDRRAGALHGLIMVAVTVAFAASLWMRLGGDPGLRDAGIYAAIAAYLVLAFGAWLGGDLPYGLGVGVQRLAWRSRLEDWQELDVAAASLEDRKPHVGRAKGGLAVFVAKIDGTVHAIGNTCTHRGCDLSTGNWSGRDSIQCPCHGSVFSVRDGAVKRGPATASAPSFETRVNDAGKIEVRSR